MAYDHIYTITQAYFSSSSTFAENWIVIVVADITLVV